MEKVSCSLRLAVTRDLIKVQFLLSPPELIIEALGNELPWACAQKFRLHNSPQKLFQRQAVVAEEAGDRHRRSSQNADPAGSFFAEYIAQQEIKPSGNGDSTESAEELSGRQAEENSLLVLPNVFGNFDFDVDSPRLLQRNNSCKSGNRKRTYNRVEETAMNTTITYKNYVGSVEYSEKDGVFYGKVLKIRALVSYEGETIPMLIDAFHSAVDDYLTLENSGTAPQC